MAKKEKTLERQQQILNTSLHMFVTRGYQGTTIRDIAKELDMSVGLLFHYFANKEALYLALLKAAAQGVGMTQDLLVHDMSPLTILETMCYMIFESFTHYPQSTSYFLLIKQALSASYLTDEMRAVIDSMDSITKTVPLIEAGQAIGEIKTGNPLALSMAFFSAIQGTAETIVCFPELPIPDSAWIIDILKNHEVTINK